jgi:hypothetical protein
MATPRRDCHVANINLSGTSFPGSFFFLALPFRDSCLNQFRRLFCSRFNGSDDRTTTWVGTTAFGAAAVI